MSKSYPEDAQVRVASVWAIPMVLRELGADPVEVLAEAGIDTKTFDNPDNLISFSARSRLIRHCVLRTGCRHFGLLVGQQGGLHSLGLVGLQARHASDVGTALRQLVRYFHLHVSGSVATGLALDGDSALVTYAVTQPKTVAVDQIVEGALAMAFNIMRTLCGPEWRATEIRIAHDKPKNIEPLHRFFRAPLHFAAEHNALVFAADWLNLPLPDADAELRLLLQRQVDALEAKHGTDFPSRVRNVLRVTLTTDHCSADKIAQLFSMHPRTLNRRLRASGTNFQAVVDEVRFEIACQSLEYTSKSLRQIADVLHYSDERAFARAFRRWSGTTPTLWRAARGK